MKIKPGHLLSLVIAALTFILGKLTTEHRVTEVKELSNDDSSTHNLRQLTAHQKIEPLSHFQRADTLTAEELKTILTEEDGDLNKGAFAKIKRHLLFYRWATLSGNEALSYSLRQGKQIHSAECALALAGWMNTDRAMAQDFVDQTKGHHGRLLRAKFAQELIYQDFAAAEQYTANLEPKGKIAITREMLQYQMNKGFDQASKWAQELPDSEIRAEALERLTAHITKEDLTKAVSFVSQLGSSPTNDRAVARVAEEWAEKNPAEAARWVRELPSGTAKNLSLEKTIREWTRSDITAAGEFLNTLKKGAFRDQGIVQYARQTTKDDPLTAIEWAKTISHPKTSEQTLKEILGSWIRRDEPAAQAWIEQTGYTWEDVHEE